jgi:hypothetical protein
MMMGLCRIIEDCYNDTFAISPTVSLGYGELWSCLPIIY